MTVSVLPASATALPLRSAAVPTWRPISMIAAASCSAAAETVVTLLVTCPAAVATVLELRPAALRSELAFRALRVSDSSPFAGSGSLSKNFFSWQRGCAATWEQRTFAPFGMCPE